MARLKNGWWVVAGNPARVGIVFAAGEESSTIHFVDETGSTIDSVIVPNSQIQRARQEDVPEQRRRDFQDTVEQLGSLTASGEQSS